MKHRTSGTPAACALLITHLQKSAVRSIADAKGKHRQPAYAPKFSYLVLGCYPVITKSLTPLIAQQGSLTDGLHIQGLPKPKNPRKARLRQSAQGSS